MKIKHNKSLKPTRFRYALAVGLALRCRGREAPATTGPRKPRIKPTLGEKACGFLARRGVRRSVVGEQRN